MRLVMSGCEEIQSSVCSHDGGVGGAQGRVGLVLLATDQTLGTSPDPVHHPQHLAQNTNSALSFILSVSAVTSAGS